MKKELKAIGITLIIISIIYGFIWTLFYYPLVVLSAIGLFITLIIYSAVRDEMD